MPSIYFTGKHVTDQELVVSPVKTFRDFIQRFLCFPALLSVGRAEFWELPEAERKKKKMVGYATACTFPKSPWQGRKLEHARPANLIFIDVDDSEDARPFVNEPGLALERLKGLNFAIYHTASSTKANPRIRVVVEADSIPVNRYSEAVLTIGKRLGLSVVTGESTRPTQAMFKSVVFADYDAEHDTHPLVVDCYEGIPFVESEILEDAEVLPGISSGGKPSRVQNGSSEDDFLTFFQFPVQGLTLEQVDEALSFVDADCSRPAWLEIAAAMKHQFGSTQDGEAYDLFDKWSATGSKYESDKDTATVWKSFIEQPAGRKPLTIRTLLKRATEAGWNSEPVKESGFKSVSDWIIFESKSALQLMNEGLNRIASAPLLTDIEKDVLITTIMQRSREGFSTPVSKTALKKGLRVREEMISSRRSEKVQTTAPPWAHDFVFITASETFFRPYTQQEYGRNAFDSKFSRQLFPTVAELQAIDRDVNEGTLHTPKYLPSLFLLNHLKCQTVDDKIYDPSAPEETFPTERGRVFVNIYLRTYREADAGLAAYAEDVWCEHLCNLIAEPAYRTHLMDWMAFNVQFPGSKIRHAIIIQGAEGCGKTIQFGVLRAALGNSNTRIINSDTIKKGWNEWASGSQVVCIEEIHVAGQNRHEIMNTLKEPITNDYIPVNERGKNTCNVPNRTNYMAFTNYHDAIVVGENSRRWWVVKSALQHKSQVDDLVGMNPDYFSRFGESLVTHAGGYRYMLENRTLSTNFKASGPAPVTTYLQEMVTDTSDAATAVLKDLWEDPESAGPLIQQDVVAFGALKAAMAMAGVSNMTDKYLTHTLRNAGFSPHGKHLVGAARQSVWARTDKINGADPVQMLLQRSENSPIL